MTNYIHPIVIPERADSLAVLFRRVHGRYAQYVNTRRGRSGPLWQGRFYSCPPEGAHASLCGGKSGPGRPGWASRRVPVDQRGGAFRLAQDEYNLIDLGYWERSGGAATWKEMFAASLAQEQIERLQCTYGGRPYGGDDFVATIEEQFGRSAKRKTRPKSRNIADGTD
jgi:putative transposase